MGKENKEKVSELNFLGKENKEKVSEFNFGGKENKEKVTEFNLGGNKKKVTKQGRTKEICMVTKQRKTKKNMWYSPVG